MDSVLHYIRGVGAKKSVWSSVSWEHDYLPRCRKLMLWKKNRVHIFSANHDTVTWVYKVHCCCCCLVAKLCPTLCDPMDCSTPGFPVIHHLLEFTQTHVRWVSDAIQPSHPLASPSPPAFNLSQHQGLFQWIGSSHQVAKLLELQLQHQSFQWIFRVGFRLDWLVWSPCRPRGSQESSPTSQFKSISSSVLNLLYDSTLTSVHDYWKAIALIIQTFVGKVMSLPFNMLSRFVIAFLSRSA